MIKSHIVYSGWEMALPKALKPEVKDLVDDIDVPTWYVILDIPRSLWDGIAGGCGIHQMDSIELYRKAFSHLRPGGLDIYSDWIKSKEYVRLATRIRQKAAIDKLSNVDIILKAVGTIHTAINLERDNRFGFSHHRIVERLVEEELEKIRGFRAAGDIQVDAHQDLFCWAYGNRTELFEDVTGNYVYHLGKPDDDFVGFCKRNLKSVVIEDIGTEVPDSTFYRIRVNEKDAFTIKMFTHEA